MKWLWNRFEGLTLQGLYDVLALRSRVFVLEQGPYLDADGLDQHSWHLQGRDDAGALQLYLRVVDPGMKYEEPSIGRVIAAPEVRGMGMGVVLMHEGLRRTEAVWPGRAVRISAQARLRRFYGDLGFEAMGEEYLEDNIPHVEMVWRPE